METDPNPDVLLRRGPVSEVWRVGDRFEKRYKVLWPWLPLAGLLKLNCPQLDARREAKNADRLRALGVEAPRVAGTASRWRLRLFGVVHETTVTLEALAGEPLDALARVGRLGRGERRAIARALGATVARMHAAGIFHRDLYLCHALWDGARIGLLDVARASPRRLRRQRWRVKDLAALALSAGEAGLGARDALAFLRAYVGPDAEIDRALVAAVGAKAARLGRHGSKA